MSQAAKKAELPKYVGYAEIAEATGIERYTIQWLMKRGKFPKSDALPTKENRWRLAVIEALNGASPFPAAGARCSNTDRRAKPSAGRH